MEVFPNSRFQYVISIALASFKKQLISHSENVTPTLNGQIKYLCLCFENIC